ncbi:MAG: MarR family transcriptional regulator [Bacteroidia bacterium]|nr:MarR family transcriptional regulator [Bacteroidia bacterium]
MENKRAYIQAIFEIIRTGHWFTDEVNKSLKEFGVTEPQFNVLRILRGAKGRPVSVGEILENMLQSSSNITRLVDKLIAKGYVKRTECPTNRRKMDITITEDGLNILEKLDEKVIAFHAPYVNKLTEKELNSLRNLIIKLTS